MKILIVTEVFHPENFIINDLAVELVKRGYEIEVMTRQPSYPQGYVYDGYTNQDYSKEIWHGITIHRFKTIEGYRDSKVKKILNYYHYVRAGKKLIKGLLDGIDLILIHQTGPLTLALPAVYARKIADIPTIIWTFDIWPDAVYAYGIPQVFPITSFLEGIIRKVYNNTDKIWVSSQRFKDTIIQYCKHVEIEYVPNYLLSTASVKSELRFDSSKINFTFTGNISISQNLDNTIRGFVRANIPNAVLNIIGDGSTLDRHRQLVSELGCSNVVFHGRYPFNQMYDILCQSDYLVLPLLAKNGLDKTEPFKIQSYLQAQKPILGIISGSGKELIETYGLGECALPDDIDDIARGFHDMILYTDEQKQNISRAAQQLMQTRFDRNRIITAIDNDIRKIVDNHIKQHSR